MDVELVAQAWRWPNLQSWRDGAGLDQHLAALVELDQVGEERVRAFAGDLLRRETAGTFCAITVSYRATGTKRRPSDDPPAE
jgi:hypothetical protein